MSEGVRCGLDKEIAPDGTYLTYFPFGAMIERSQMTPYHKKLLEVGLLRAAMPSVDVDIYAVSTLLEMRTIIVDTYRD